MPSSGGWVSRKQRPPQSTQTISFSGANGESGKTRSLAGMRVISGELGGRKLLTPDGLATRPTTDKVRQAVFNSLGSMGVLEGATVADLYAGCGALGIEALSRGAESCVFVERDRSALTALKANLKTLGLETKSHVAATDVIAYAPGMTTVDVAFADPPYTFTNWDGLLLFLRAGLVVAESDREVAAILGWELVRTKRYGRTVITVLERLP